MVHDDSGMLYKYGLERYIKDAIKRIKKDFGDICISALVTVDNVDNSTCQYTNEFTVRVYVDNMLKVDGDSHIVINRSNSMEVKISSSFSDWSDKSYERNVYAVMLFFRTLFTETDIRNTYKYMVSERFFSKDAQSILLGRENLSISSLVRRELHELYSPICDDDLNCLSGIGFIEYEIDEKTKREIEKKIVDGIIDRILKRAVSNGVSIDNLIGFKTSYETLCFDGTALTMSVDVDPTKAVRMFYPFKSCCCHNCFEDIRDRIASMLIEFYKWYRKAMHIYSDDKDFTLFKEAIMTEIGVNL